MGKRINSVRASVGTQGGDGRVRIVATRALQAGILLPEALEFDVVESLGGGGDWSSQMDQKSALLSRDFEFVGGAVALARYHVVSTLIQTQSGGIKGVFDDVELLNVMETGSREA